ncbi:MAG: endonuclease/exonuclease/phosphatase family protein [Bacteroidales bacterium]
MTTLTLRKAIVNAVILILIMLLFSTTGCGKSDPDSNKETGKEEPGTTSFMTLKVMSFNVRYLTDDDSGDTNWEKRKDPCVKMIKTQSPDIFGLQEPRDEQRDYLIAQLGDYKFAYVHAEGSVTSAQSGHTVLGYKSSKFDLVKAGRFWLSATPDTPSTPWACATDRSIRTCVWVELKEKTSGEIVYFFNTHFPYKVADNEARILCSNLCLTRMKNIAGADANTFLVGDLNTSSVSSDSRAYSIQPLFSWMQDGRTSAASSDAKASYNGYDAASNSAAKNQLDHIFLKNMTPNIFTTDDSDAYGVKYVSDHYPVFLTVKIAVD